MWKFCGVSVDSPANCAFLQNFHIRKLDEITVFYQVNDVILGSDVLLWSLEKYISTKREEVGSLREKVNSNWCKTFIVE